MRDVLVDSDGALVCPYCNGRNFDRERTGKGKTTGFLTVGVGVFLVPKCMHCLACGRYSKSGSAQPVPPSGPSPTRAAELRARYDAARDQRLNKASLEHAAPIPPADRLAPKAAVEAIAQLGSLRRDGLLDDAEFTQAKRRVLEGDELEGDEPLDVKGLRQLDELRQSGALTDDEYAPLREAILCSDFEREPAYADVVLIAPARGLFRRSGSFVR